MASRELDEHNEAYDNSVNTRIWNKASRQVNGDMTETLRLVVKGGYIDLIRTHNLAGDGLTRPRKRRVA